MKLSTPIALLSIAATQVTSLPAGPKSILKSASLHALEAIRSNSSTNSTHECKSPTIFRTSFDDLESVPDLSARYPINYHNGLYWNALDVVQASDAPFNAIQPESSPNVAANGILANAVHGGVQLVRGDTIGSFFLSSLYFACVVSIAETEENTTPTPCEVVFSGHRKGITRPVYTKRSCFKPTTDVKSKMMEVRFEFEDFKQVDHVSISVKATQGNAPPSTVGLLFDGATYIACAKE